MRKFLLLASALSLATPVLAASDNPVETHQYRAHAEFLASDLLEGREAGTRGYDIAANYVANQFRAMGIAPGDPDGDYMQPIVFVRYDADPEVESYWEIDGQRFVHGDEVAVDQRAFAQVIDDEAELVWIGNGLYAPEYGIDQIGDIDLDGKIAVITAFADRPDGLPGDVGAHLGSTRTSELARRGAVGTIRVIPDDWLENVGWERLRSFLAGSSNWADAEGHPFIDHPTLTLGGVPNSAVRDALFAGSAMEWAAIVESERAGVTVAPFALGKSLRVVAKTEVAPDYQSANVVGLIEGSDSALKDELIVMVAHLDHVGIDEDAKPGADNIHNGLFDNALGVSAVLEVARLFAEADTAPRRSIAFVALAAEEKGLLGSEWLANNLDQFEGKQVVGTINLDMPIIPADFDRVVAHGSEHSTIGKQIDAALDNFSINRIDDPEPDQAYFVRSDHYSFVKAGIPSVGLDPIVVEEAQPLAEEFIKERYHKVGDQIGQQLDWDAAAKFAYVNYLITRRMTDDDARPLWYADSYFGTSTAPDAEKAER